MKFHLNEEQNMLKKIVQQLAEKESRPEVAEWEARGEPVARKYFKKPSDLGLLELPIAAEYGNE